VTCAFVIVANGDVYQQIVLPRHADVADFEIGAAVALTREHPLVSGGETSVVTNALQRPQYMVVRAGPIRSMVEAGVDVVPGTFTTHEIPLTGAWHVRKRSEGRVVGEPQGKDCSLVRYEFVLAECIIHALFLSCGLRQRCASSRA
jgi:hypothetical protein